MPRPFEHARAVNAPSVRESAWSDIFGGNAPTISTSAKPPSDSPNLTPGINSIIPTNIETTSKYSSPATPTGAITTISDEGSLLNCSHCDRAFTSRIGLVGHLRIHCTETDESVPGRLHRPRAFNHRMGLLGHTRLHENLR
ncbi:unnamed protein product [Schistocephalus solidus]|uniref:C2H2-type domain-containing protein n=1 Tax=Schistocephalus solidus TaxID=70667 RepID=A0A183SYV4_SCHSO|nr:unnamed protein product [Schistocephalus solidus]